MQHSILKVLAGLFACALLGSTAYADTVFLTNGGTLEGKVTVKDGKVYIEQPDGVIMIEEERVDHIEKKVTTLEEYQERFAKIDEKAADAGEKYASLGQWCTEQRMKNQAALCYRKAITADPNNERARTALGFVKYNGQWMTFDEVQQARGMVRHKNGWVSPEAKEELTRLEAAQELEKARALVEQTKLDLERAKLARVEAESARAQAETARLESIRRRYDYDSGYGYGYSMGGLYYPPVYYYYSGRQACTPPRTSCGTGSGSSNAGLQVGIGYGTGSFSTSTKINP